MVTKKQKIPTRYSYHRPVLSDVLPFEVPPSFTNNGYFIFLTRYNVRFEFMGKLRYVTWECQTDSVDNIISLIFNTLENKATHLTTDVIAHDGRTINVRKWRIDEQKTWTRPFSFSISHKKDGFRRLSIIHPRNQLHVSDFYFSHHPHILYFTGLSPFSIRRPSLVAKTIFFRDNLHQKIKGLPQDSIEQRSKEYENLGSYFKYTKFSNIFKFYEHYQYHNSEKKFDNLLKLDISKCFDSIYTHTLPWTTLGASAAKENLLKSKPTFGGKFDLLMQEMNQGETNGILIGPEFSRIFAEIILQGVDCKLDVILGSEYELKHKVDFEIYRYVDDYFIFYNDENVADIIKKNLSSLLMDIKLHLNSEKSITYSKPIITDLTIAKNRVNYLLDEHFNFSLNEEDNPTDPEKKIFRFSVSINSNRLIIDYKAALSETKVPYGDILNYTLAAIERNIEDIFTKFQKVTDKEIAQKELAKAVLAIMEFSFFIYAAEPRVTFTVRLTRIISIIVDNMNSLRVIPDHKQQVFKYIHDNIARQLRKSRQEPYKEVETLYLILALAKLGRGFKIDQDILASYFGLRRTKKTFTSDKSLDYFSLTVCLLYIRDRKQYSTLKSFIQKNIFQIFESRKAYVKRDADLLMLYLDLQCCPYLSQNTKRKLGKYFSHSLKDLKLIWNASDYWFTDWKGYNLSLELDKKKAREVY